MKIESRVNWHEGLVSLRQKAYQLLKQKIITGEFAPGDVLSESELADLLGVSKTPVREALTQLQHDNLVSLIPRKGYLVTNLTLKDIQEIFEVRLILERAATMLAAERITAEELATVERYLEMDFDPTHREDLLRYVQANRDFHLEIARASHNHRLCEYLDRIFVDAQRLQYMDLTIWGAPWVWQRDHKRIVEALRHHDKDAAAAAVEASIEEARTRLLAM